MRYRIYRDRQFTGELDLQPDSDYDAPLPLVHVFRDDELDELADAILRAAYTDPWHDRDAVVDAIRNHTSERQPGSADGAG